jgi:hypothetical protein
MAIFSVRLGNISIASGQTTDPSSGDGITVLEIGSREGQTPCLQNARRTWFAEGPAMVLNFKTKSHFSNC